MFLAKGVTNRLVIGNQLERYRRKQINTKCLQSKDDRKRFTLTSGVLALAFINCTTDLLDEIYLPIFFLLSQESPDGHR